MACFNVPNPGHSSWKAVIFHPGARAEIQQMSRPVRKELGKLLKELQLGRPLSMPHSRPMPIVALGVEELRVKDESGQYRAFAVRKMRHGILVLHVFAKKSRETPPAAIALARRRLKEM